MIFLRRKKELDDKSWMRMKIARKQGRRKKRERLEEKQREKKKEREKESIQKKEDGWRKGKLDRKILLRG